MSFKTVKLLRTVVKASREAGGSLTREFPPHISEASAEAQTLAEARFALGHSHDNPCTIVAVRKEWSHT